jgi:transposase
VVPDETVWRVGGRPAWLHTLVGPEATAYVIDLTRSGAVAEAILGPDYDGTLIHDGWSPYDQFKDARHQQCLNHTIRIQSLGFSSQRRFVQPRSPRGPVRLRR